MKTAFTLLALLAASLAHATPPVKPAKAPRTVSVAPVAVANPAVDTRVAVDAVSVSHASGGQGGALNLAGASIGTSERSAPSVFTAGATVPGKSCRLTAGLGGGSAGGSGSGGVPIGNDQTCLSAAAIELLDALKARGIAVTQADYTRAACKVEGMAELSPCQALAKQEGKQAEAAPVVAVRELP